VVRALRERSEIFLQFRSLYKSPPPKMANTDFTPLHHKPLSASAEASPLLSRYDKEPEEDALSPEAGDAESTVQDQTSTGVSPEEQVLKVMDRLEDDWDKATYEEVVPLEIRLALEERVFGWTHLTSDILGHLGFTLGAFLIVYVFLWYPTERLGLSWVRWTVSLFAGVSSFRMVRRRRQVYFRAAYGSRAYRDDEDRRQKEVAEADKASWLGRMREKRNRKNVKKALLRAESNFTKHYHSKREVERTLTDLSVSKENPMLKRRRPSFQTIPVPDMQSVQHDQILFDNGPIHNVMYTHGGFFGAAPFLLTNSHWISILRHLMPDVYVEISRRIRVPPQRLIHWAENNPVVAAYGSAHELELNGVFPSIEWDVFLNPALVLRVERILQKRADFLHCILPDSTHLKPLQTISAAKIVSYSDRNILRYYDRQLQLGVHELVDKMLIAHGKLGHLLLEQTGIAKYYTYSRVRRTRRTLGGGIYARQWMAVFAESLKLGFLDESPAGSPKSETEKTSLFAMARSSCPDTSISESVDTVKSIAKSESPIGLVLDVKSRHVPKNIWGCVVDTLRASGVRVEGVGSFVIEDIRDISKYTINPVKEILFFHSAGDMQHACHDGSVRNGDIVFFNAGSLLWQPLQENEASTGKACRQIFGSFDPLSAKAAYRLLPFALPSKAMNKNMGGAASSESSIENYKNRFNLSIGLYVQEFAIDEKAVDILVRLVNETPRVYNLGLCWGGINGITIRGIQPGRFTATDGFWYEQIVVSSLLLHPTLAHHFLVLQEPKTSWCSMELQP
jgi:hypothetical protein